jgi:ADP-ribosyltransferase exoenzyme
VSALTDPKGFKLTTLVAAQRGMTEGEALRYVEFDVLPNLSQPPIDPESSTITPDAQVVPQQIVVDWLAGKFPDPVVAAVLAFKFNPNQPRDSDGQWTDGTPEVSAPNFKSPSGTSSTPTSVSPAGKKITPAVIYKKHADGAVVAESGNRRMRWDAEAKKFVVEERQSGTWQETARLTKSAAYEDAKAPGRWLQPGATPTADAPTSPSKTTAHQQYWDKYGEQYSNVKLTDQERGAVDAYTLNGFGIINGIARGDAKIITDPEIADELDQWDDVISGLNSVITKMPSLQEDITVFRGVGGQHVPVAGAGWKENGFTSATWDSNFAQSWASDESQPTVVELRLKKGQQAWVTAPGPESEVILPLDTKYRVISETSDSGVRRVVAEIDSGLPPTTPSQTPQPAAADSQPTAETTTFSDDQASNLDYALNELRTLSKVAREHAQTREEYFAKSANGKILDWYDHQQYKDATNAIKNMEQEATPLALMALDLLEARDGAPWGSVEYDKSRWASAGKPSVVMISGDTVKFQKARDQYVMNDLMTITNNASLRSKSPSASAKAWRGRMRSMINAMTLINDTTVYRGAALTPTQIMTLQPGVVVRDAGIMSTDEIMSNAELYVKSRRDNQPGTLSVIFKIHVPAKTHGADVQYGEYVFEDNTELRIVEVQRNGDRIDVTAEMQPKPGK